MSALKPVTGRYASQRAWSGDGQRRRRSNKSLAAAGITAFHPAVEVPKPTPEPPEIPSLSNWITQGELDAAVRVLLRNQIKPTLINGEPFVRFRAFRRDGKVVDFYYSAACPPSVDQREPPAGIPELDPRNPFRNQRTGVEAKTVRERLGSLKEMDAEQLFVVFTMVGCQKSVVQAAERRLRKLEKEVR